MNKQSLEKIVDNLTQIALELSDTVKDSKKVEEIELPQNTLKSTLDCLKKLMELGVPVYGEIVKEENIGIEKSDKDERNATNN